jgi:hypothetical protein
MRRCAALAPLAKREYTMHNASHSSSGAGAPSSSARRVVYKRVHMFLLRVPVYQDQSIQLTALPHLFGCTVSGIAVGSSSFEPATALPTQSAQHVRTTHERMCIVVEQIHLPRIT